MIHVTLDGEPDTTKRSCYDCYHCQAAVTWWCRNPEAIAWRGTAIPGVHDCPFWEPLRRKKDLGWLEWLFPLHVVIKGMGWSHGLDKRSKHDEPFTSSEHYAYSQHLSTGITC